MTLLDLEKVLVTDVLSDLGYCCTVTPPTLQTILATSPVLRIYRVGGSWVSDGDMELTDIRVEALALASDSQPRLAFDTLKSVTDRLTGIDGRAVAGGGIDRCAFLVLPIQQPHPDPAVTRYAATFRLTTRAA